MSYLNVLLATSDRDESEVVSHSNVQLMAVAAAMACNFHEDCVMARLAAAYKCQGQAQAVNVQQVSSSEYPSHEAWIAELLMKEP